MKVRRGHKQVKKILVGKPQVGVRLEDVGVGGR